MAPIISTSSNKQCTEHCNIDPELPSKNEKRFFNLFSNIFLSPRPIDSGGRKTAGGARLPLVSSWPARIEGARGSTPGLLDLLPLGTASGSVSSLSGVLTPETSRVSEVAPQLPELGLGPAFGIDFDSVPGWGQASALSGVSLGRRSLGTANDTGSYEQHEGLVVLKVIAVVLTAFWFAYVVGWVFSCTRERVRSRRGILPL